MNAKPAWFSLLGTIALCLGQPSPGLAQEKAERLPNIVFIISDDHGWNDYAFLGHPHLHTPQLDKLAAQSLVYTRGYVTSSLCCPSLASILTGLYPHQNRITSNDPPFARKKGVAPAKDPDYLKGRQWFADQMARLPTLVRLLQALGYRSLQTGKWWHGHFRSGGFTHGMSHGNPAKQGRHGDEGLAIGRQTMQPIFDFIAETRQAGKPFFVWYAPMLPHLPHDAPQRLVGKYQDKAPSLHIARYWANVEWFDESCGQLLDYLARNGLAENTIVIYLADNGWVQDPRTGQMVRSKRTQYEAGHRTPIMLRWPGRVQPKKIEQPVSSIDLVPTVLRLVGAKPTPEMQGLNLLDPQAVARRQAIFGECFSHDAVNLNEPAANLQWRWLVAGDWRLIVPHAANVPDGKMELYNLAQDPQERSNLAERERNRVMDLQKKLDAWWTPSQPRP